MAEHLAQLALQSGFQGVVDPAQDQLGAAKAKGHQADAQGRDPEGEAPGRWAGGGFAASSYGGSGWPSTRLVWIGL